MDIVSLFSRPSCSCFPEHQGTVVAKADRTICSARATSATFFLRVPACNPVRIAKLRADSSRRRKGGLLLGRICSS
jgi:hypothetical protein